MATNQVVRMDVQHSQGETSLMVLDLVPLFSDWNRPYHGPLKAIRRNEDFLQPIQDAMARPGPALRVKAQGVPPSQITP